MIPCASVMQHPEGGEKKKERKEEGGETGNKKKISGKPSNNGPQNLEDNFST